MPLGFGGSSEKKRSSSAFIASVSQQLFSEIQNVTSSTHRSRQASHAAATTTTTTYLELFKELWKETIAIFSKNLINDDDVDKVKENLNQMMSLLLNELNKAILSNEAAADGAKRSAHLAAKQLVYGPVWEFFFKQNIFEVIFLWSLSYPEYLYDLKYEQLCHYENLIGHLQATEQTSLLFSAQIHQPLFSLLNHCASHNSPLIENHMIAILNQLCVCICKNDKLLTIFFDPSTNSSASKPSTSSDFVYQHNGFHDLVTSTPASASSSTFYSYDRQQGPAKFLIFSLLIPYIHKEGSLGQQARDALLLIMQLSARNPSLARYIVDNTDFCPILATGLSGLYSDLPPKLTARESFEEIRYLQEADIASIPSLNKFINSLEFCNNVIQISHPLIANQLLQFVYHGFLVPVLAPALTQDADLYPSDLAKLEEYTNCIDEIVTATVYLDLFLRRVNEINLQRLFLKFILYFKLNEETTLLDTLISRINSNNKLTLTTLMLFYSMIDLNSEDVIYKLILVHLMPCKHLMKSQIATLKESSYEINGLNAQAFLSLSTNFMNLDGSNTSGAGNNNNNNSKSLVSLSSASSEPTPISDWINAIFDSREVLTLLSYIDSMRFNFIDYLKDAKSGIKSTASRTSRWSHKYDAVVNLAASMQAERRSDQDGPPVFRKRPAVNRPALDLDFEAEEFLLHLNLSASGLDEPEAAAAAKSRRSTMNLSTGARETGDESDLTNKLGGEETTGDKSKGGGGAEASSSRKKPKKAASKSKSSSSGKKSAAGNDFYVLSFDNELSESESSSNEDDESLSSSMTSSNPSLNEDQKSTDQQLSDLDERNRGKLAEFMFAANESFDGSLSSFLSALDSYFVSNTEVRDGLEVQKRRRKSFNEINKICDEIVNIYNECFMVRSTPKPILSLESSFGGVRQKSEEKKTTTPVAPVELAKDEESHVAQETDIGPFLGAVFKRLENFLCNSLQINFLITGLLARLAYYPQLLLRSFLLNQNIVMQPSIKSLMQVLTTVKDKIDACSHTYDNNFSLLYLKAKLFLVKRLLHLRSKSSLAVKDRTALNQSREVVVTSPASTSVQMANNTTTNPAKKKPFTVDRILNIFFKPPTTSTQTADVQFTNNLDSSSSTQTSSSSASSANDESLVSESRSPAFDQLFTPGLELDLDEIKNRSSGTRSSKTAGQLDKSLDKSYEDFVQLEVDWEDVNTRNIAYSTVIYDEFIKELAAICQEHCVLTVE